MFRFLLSIPLLIVMKIRTWNYFYSYDEEACIFDYNAKLNHIVHFSYKCKSLSFFQRPYRHRSDFDSPNTHTSSRFRWIFASILFEIKGDQVYRFSKQCILYPVA